MTALPHSIAEIVTFRAGAGIDEHRMATLAASATAFLESRPGYLRRHMSVADNGTFTDHVVWMSREAAMSAAEAFMNAPSVQGFIAAIDPGSVAVRHERVVLSDAKA